MTYPSNTTLLTRAHTSGSTPRLLTPPLRNRHQKVPPRVTHQAFHLPLTQSRQLRMIPSIRSRFESFIPFIRFAVSLSVSLFPRSSGARTE